VYILKSPSSGRHYIGITNNLEHRLHQHLAGGTHATAGAKDWRVVWSKPVDDHMAARELEKKIKARGAGRFLEDQGALDRRNIEC
jgi:putative endonuclease